MDKRKDETTDDDRDVSVCSCLMGRAASLDLKVWRMLYNLIIISTIAVILIIIIIKKLVVYMYIYRIKLIDNSWKVYV
jgi:hypothetical protein